MHIAGILFNVWLVAEIVQIKCNTLPGSKYSPMLSLRQSSRYKTELNFEYKSFQDVKKT